MTEDRIKIMYVIGSLGNGRAGTERNLLTIIEHLDRDHFKPYLISLQDCEYIQRGEFVCDTSCLHLYRMLTPSMWRVRKLLADRMRQLGIDIVQTFFVEGHLVGGGAARQANIKAIISSRRNLGYNVDMKEKLLLRIANRYPHRFLANSQAVADSVSKLESTGRDRFDVIYNGVVIPPETDDGGKALIPGRKSVVMVANLRPVKSVETLIRAAALVVKSVPDAQFVIIGDGPQRESLTALAAELSLTGHIDFVGSQADVHSHLVGAAVGVLTSTSEGFSNAILEYMCAALPVVATDVGGNRETVIAGKTGYLIPPANPQALADKLIHLLAHSETARTLGHVGRERVEHVFSLETMIRIHQDYYRRLVSRPRNIWECR